MTTNQTNKRDCGDVKSIQTNKKDGGDVINIRQKKDPVDDRPRDAKLENGDEPKKVAVICQQ